MRRAFKIPILVALLVFSNLQNVFSQECGVQRRAVKQGFDTTFDQVDLDHPIRTSISQMNTWVYPPASQRKNVRVNIHEKRVYTIRATLTKYKKEHNDSDYHLVLEDDNGNTLIGEIISPECIESDSPIFDEVETARQQFDHRFTRPEKPTGSFKDANEKVTVTGIGFFDFKHNQKGLARNAIEIHPILHIQFPTAPPTGPFAITIPQPAEPAISAESFDSEWIPFSKNKRKQIIRPVDSFAKSGTGVALLGGYNLADDSLSRSVEIPADAKWKLTFSANVVTSELATAVPFDILAVEIKSPSEEEHIVPITLNNRTSVDSQNKKGVYFERSVGLSEFAGQTIEIRFHAVTDKRRPTSFRIDDILITQ